MEPVIDVEGAQLAGKLPPPLGQGMEKGARVAPTAERNPVAHGPRRQHEETADHRAGIEHGYSFGWPMAERRRWRSATSSCAESSATRPHSSSNAWRSDSATA